MDSFPGLCFALCFTGTVDVSDTHSEECHGTDDTTFWRTMDTNCDLHRKISEIIVCTNGIFDENCFLFPQSEQLLLYVFKSVNV